MAKKIGKVLGIGALAGILTVLPASISWEKGIAPSAVVRGESVELRNLIGWWQLIPPDEFRETQAEYPSAENFMVVEFSENKLIGLGAFLAIDSVGIVELNSLENGELEGKIWRFLDLGVNSISIPIRGTVRKDKSILDLTIMASKVDQSLFPSELKSEFAEDVAMVGKLLPSETIQSRLEQRAITARKSEAISYLSAINRAQQAYRLENSGFATSLEELQLGLESETENYLYEIKPIGSLTDTIQTIAIAKQNTLSSFTGAVLVLPDDTMKSIICESEEPSQAVPLAPVLTGEELLCPVGYRELN